MAKRVPTQLVIAAFPKEDTAKVAVDALLDGMVSGNIRCTNIAILTKDKDGKTTIKELGKTNAFMSAMGSGISAGVVGALVGGLSFLFFGPAGFVAGAQAGGAAGAAAGAAIGGYGASKIESMDKKKLEGLGSTLNPENSAIVAIFDEVLVKKKDYEAAMTEFKEPLDAILKRMGEKIHLALQKNLDIAYGIAVGEDGLVATRLVEGEGAVNLTELVLTPDGILAESINVGEGGATVKAVAATSEGAVGLRAAASEDMIMYEVASEAAGSESVDLKAGVIVADDQGNVDILQIEAAE